MSIINDLKYKNECFFGEYRPGAFLKILMSDGTSAVILYRLSRFFRKLHLGFMGFIFSELNRVLNGCVIGRDAQFGKGFVIMHPFGIVINSGVRGGDSIVIESSAVIGAARNGLPVKVPNLGSNIFIGSGAKILGDIRIGDNVKIGANAVVLKDVPGNSTAVGVPAKVVKIKDTGRLWNILQK